VPVSEAVRRDLALLSARKSARVYAWTRDRPTDWRPTTVRDPASGELFTQEGAWMYIVELLENNHVIETIVLAKPPDKTGYVLHVDVGGSASRIYIKLELGCGKVYGRSFHYDE
jgi:hypothetical protein